MKECDKIQSLLVPFVLNELTAAEVEAVENHLKTCTDCKRIFAQQQQVFKQLDTWGNIEPSKELYNQLKQKIKLRKSRLIQKKLIPLITLKHYMTVRRAILGIALVGLICLFIFIFDDVHRKGIFKPTNELIHIAAIDSNKNHIPTLIDSILSFSSAPAKQTQFFPKLTTSLDYSP